MRSARQISSERLARTDYVSAQIDEPVSKIKDKMEAENIREIPVLDDSRYEGMISYRELVENVHTDPTSVKAETVMRQAPEVEAGKNMIELARLRNDAGVRRFVMTEGDRLKAVVGEEDIVYPLAEGVEELQGVSVGDLMTRDVIKANEDDKQDHVVSLMRDHGISRVPILDRNGRLAGIVSSMQTLRAMVPRDQMTRGEVVGDKDDMSKITAEELMDISPVTINDASKGVIDAISMMEERGAREVIVVDDDERPVGLLTLKDVLDYLASLEETNAVLVNLVGVQTESQKQAVNDKIQSAVQGKLGRVVTPNEIKLHVKAYEEEGTQKKYSINATLFSEIGATRVNKHGWDLLTLVDEVIDGLYERASETKQRQRDRERGK
ncbi:MAG: CBS domain-containing protein [Candidatus Nanohaloarchaeota archaeon QJJ-5]|nr:CBS domain-containing protein [Candidatus Nanohaloarchaeota archaeon QJJ-5]